jgi:plasmid stabilization system protein ParE
MPRGDKSAYTERQKRQAEHIEEGYEHRGVPEGEAERRAWATVNKETGGGKKSGSGRGKPQNHAPSRKGGRLGGKAAAKRPRAARSHRPRKRQLPASAGQRLTAEHTKSAHQAEVAGDELDLIWNEPLRPQQGRNIAVPSHDCLARLTVKFQSGRTMETGSPACRQTGITVTSDTVQISSSASDRLPTLSR